MNGPPLADPLAQKMSEWIASHVRISSNVLLGAEQRMGISSAGRADFQVMPQGVDVPARLIQTCDIERSVEKKVRVAPFTRAIVDIVIERVDARRFDVAIVSKVKGSVE